MIHVTDLISIDMDKSGSWKLLERTAPGRRPKISYYRDLEQVCNILLEKRAGDCTSLRAIVSALGDARRDILAHIVSRAPRKEFNDLTADERLVFLATGRISAQKLTFVNGRKSVDVWAGRIGGKIITTDGEYRHPTPEAAKAFATQAREKCRADAVARGIL